MKTLIEGRGLRMRSIRNVVVRAAVLALALTALGATPAAGADSDTLQAENGSNLWLVELKGSAASFRGEAKKAGVKYSERFAFSELWNGVSIVADAAQVGTIEALPSVAAVYPNQTFLDSCVPTRPELRGRAHRGRPRQERSRLRRVRNPRRRHGHRNRLRPSGPRRLLRGRVPGHRTAGTSSATRTTRARPVFRSARSRTPIPIRTTATATARTWRASSAPTAGSTVSRRA